MVLVRVRDGLEGDEEKNVLLSTRWIALQCVCREGEGRLGRG